MSEEISVKERIIDVSLKLFYEKGYDNTTVDEIIQACGISKGGFYHYFQTKGDLLSSLSYMFDSQYEKALKKMDSKMNSFEKLIYLSRYLFCYIEERVPVDILSLVYSTQVIKKGEKHLLNQNRVYYKTLNTIIKEGQKNGVIIREKSLGELTKLYAMQERAVLYDWCICEGSYPLSSYGIDMLKFFLKNIKGNG
ncbi:TetR/AcrR family transcriptional regulator [Muricomes intestini]|uniref:TetR/AcrR family transcriptional regulator n=1 Tax=Muricomes intestini TaxID=1796634 RepID=UPI000E7DD5E3|nr:TetR/AcrR family transcriptional regulator [Lachnospiraceae bacterium]HCR83365.1 TetR/AcrR family transcriptional regulator [Lachnospiraceae bacterium]